MFFFFGKHNHDILINQGIVLETIHGIFSATTFKLSAVHFPDACQAELIAIHARETRRYNSLYSTRIGIFFVLFQFFLSPRIFFWFQFIYLMTTTSDLLLEEGVRGSVEQAFLLPWTVSAISSKICSRSHHSSPQQVW